MKRCLAVSIAVLVLSPFARAEEREPSSSESAELASSFLEELMLNSPRHDGSPVRTHEIRDVDLDGTLEVLEHVSAYEHAAGFLNAELEPAFEWIDIYIRTGDGFVRATGEFHQFLTLRREAYEHWLRVLDNPDALSADSRGLLEHNRDEFEGIIRSYIDRIDELILGVTSARAPKSEEATISRHVRVMTSMREPWEARCSAEDALRGLDAESVLGGLLEHISEGMPALPIWNSAGREHDREAPVEWQIWYAVDRSWRHHLRGPPSAALGQLLVELLPRAESPAGRERVLDDIARHWYPDGDEPLRRLMMDPDAVLSVRRAAGFCLMLHRGKEYHEILLDLAAGATGEERLEWWELLVDPRHRAETGTDPAVVALGFEILADERGSDYGDVHAAYFVSCDLGAYLERDFKPDQDLERYRGERGLNDTFFADTVENALAWWDENRPDRQ